MMTDDELDQIMLARRIANDVRLGKRTLSKREWTALAEGFEACDRLRAEAELLTLRRSTEASTEEAIEASYWAFDARQGRQGEPYKSRPQPERDAFKYVVRELLAAQSRKAQP